MILSKNDLKFQSHKEWQLLNKSTVFKEQLYDFLYYIKIINTF